MGYLKYTYTYIYISLFANCASNILCRALARAFSFRRQQAAHPASAFTGHSGCMYGVAISHGIISGVASSWCSVLMLIGYWLRQRAQCVADRRRSKSSASSLQRSSLPRNNRGQQQEANNQQPTAIWWRWRRWWQWPWRQGHSIDDVKDTWLLRKLSPEDNDVPEQIIHATYEENWLDIEKRKAS